MSNSFEEKEKQIQLDEVKLRKMRIKIYNLEREFYRTKRYSVPIMKDKIRKIIEEEYRKRI